MEISFSLEPGDIGAFYRDYLHREGNLSIRGCFPTVLFVVLACALHAYIDEFYWWHLLIVAAPFLVLAVIRVLLHYEATQAQL